MIHLTRLNHFPLVVNADLIENIEANPDTVISLTTGQKLIVLEPPDEVIDRVIQFRRSLLTKTSPGHPHHLPINSQDDACSGGDAEEF